MFCLGLDIGYSNLKMVFGGGGSPVVEKMLPAGAAPLDKLPTTFGEAGSDIGIKVSVDGQPWVAGVSTHILENWERELHPEYTSTDSYKALFHGALVSTGRDVIDKVVTGLPVSQYLDFNRREALAEALKGRHRVAGSQMVEVKEVAVLPQPVGAYMHLMSSSSDEDMEAIEEGLVIVLDPGFFSFDYVAVQRSALRKGSAGTSNKAMSRVLEEAAKLISADHEAAGVVSKEKLENAIQNGKRHILVFGERVEIRPYLVQAAGSVAPQAMSKLRQAMREEDSGADIVLLAGGGGSIYEQAAKEVFPKSRVVVPSSPVMANAQGFHFFGS